jgi:tetratricopeptide (TPR) repeat protein
MRLPRPSLPFGNNATGKDEAKQIDKKVWTIRLLALVLIVMLAIGGVKFYKDRHKPKQTFPPSPSAVDESIKSLQSSTELGDKRNLAGDYTQKGDYNQAEEILNSVAHQTNDLKDWVGLINLCSQYNVTGKQNCLSTAAAKVKPQLSNLSFYEAYSIGSMLDQGNDKKDAIVFYQKAYDIYDPAAADIYTKTKDQIKQRIDQLNAS